MKNSVRILYLFLGLLICISLSAQKPSSQYDKLNEYKISNRDFERILDTVVSHERVKNAPFVYVWFGKVLYKGTFYNSFNMDAGEDWNTIQKVNGYWGYLIHKNKIFVLSGPLFDGIFIKTNKQRKFYYTAKPFDFRDLTTCGGPIVYYYYIDGAFISGEDF
jgi:hypothetical protein